MGVLFAKIMHHETIHFQLIAKLSCREIKVGLQLMFVFFIRENKSWLTVFGCFIHNIKTFVLYVILVKDKLCLLRLFECE